MSDSPHNLKHHNYHLEPLQIDQYGMRVWMSICSQHRSYNPTCKLCNTGSWSEVVPKEDGCDGECY